jgi:UDP-glucose 4-epimerase
VTGAGGYIGQRLVERFAFDGVAVRALVRTPVPWSSGGAGSAGTGSVEEMVGDLVADPGVAEKAAAGVDLVVHLAGANEVAAAADPSGSLAQTVLAAERVAASGVARVVYLSTVHVYGEALSPGAVVDEATPAQPVHPYAAARLACEEVFRGSGVPAMIFRLTNGVGAPARPDVARWSLVANELCREGAVSGTLTLRTAGVQWRDFIALTDVVAGLSRLARGHGTAFTPGLYNMGSGTSVRVRDLAELIAESFEAAARPRPALAAPAAPAEVPGPYRVDVSALTRVGLAGSTSLRGAVDETVRFCLDHVEVLGQ